MEISRKRTILSVSDKIDILKELEKGNSNASVCKKFNLKSSTVSTIWKNKEKIFKASEEVNLKTKKVRMCENPDLDQAVFKRHAFLLQVN